MRILGVIPARYESSRFPGKPLIDIAGKSMIQRVYEQCLKSSSLNKVIVATDDQRIADHVKLFGGNVALTSNKHQSGTDRCAEVAINYPEFDVLVNIQGDEPMIDPHQIDLLCKCFENPETLIATLVKKISSNEELFNENTPKVILNKNKEAVLFSRTTIPFLRGRAKETWIEHYTFYKHIGIYAFLTETLKALTKLPVSVLESAEALEQLRWIENGYRIQAAITDKEIQAIDTPEDLEKLLKLIQP
ncbi:MAG: 3-deoxy-manno-octulosonate cytidylyltransferase [Daejeonella sp.]|uniref:3-deoxy-manno-octulosonate cytidylyltransferase n=1 Tax=Daejeonella sp. TaxID=2805397 RepID=UPI0027337614|nr:3-deoxy-manno-octulosonate cytidylyltransferase [Daejeonella sp.]MDP3469904.1 3-deoxy-manno-octulosonate cytidylyltransferase [Daejeonella sp.]